MKNEKRRKSTREVVEDAIHASKDGAVEEAIRRSRNRNRGEPWRRMEGFRPWPGG